MKFLFATEHDCVYINLIKELTLVCMAFIALISVEVS